MFQQYLRQYFLHCLTIISRSHAFISFSVYPFSSEHAMIFNTSFFSDQFSFDQETIVMALSNHELACVYAALILADDNIDVSEEKISAILKAAQYQIEPFWPGLFANALQGLKINDLIKNVGSAPAAGAAAAPAATTTAAAAPADNKPAAAAAKKEEKPAAKEESDDEMVKDQEISSWNSPLHSSSPSSRASAYSIKLFLFDPFKTHNTICSFTVSVCVCRSFLISNKKKIKK